MSVEGKLKDGNHLYRDDEVKIQKIGEQLQRKYYFRSATLANLNEFADEAKALYAEAGYLINVDISPALLGVGAPDIAVVGRINFQEPDHDHIKHDVVKEYKDLGKL